MLVTRMTRLLRTVTKTDFDRLTKTVAAIVTSETKMAVTISKTKMTRMGGVG